MQRHLFQSFLGELIDNGWFYGFDLLNGGNLLEQTLDRHHNTTLNGKVFRYLLTVFQIELPEQSFIDIDNTGTYFPL